MHTIPLDMLSGFLIQLGLTVWVCLLVYNVISAMFGIDRLRRSYVDLLRKLYAVSYILSQK